MPDQIIDAAMAHGLHADACRTHPMVGWIVMKGPAEYPGKFVARLVTDASSPYLLVADTLAEIHATLPGRLVCWKRQPSDPPQVVEIWFAS
jgi:hypothetical protein